MRGGHNRVPDEVKRLRGTDQPCRMNPNAPAAVPVEIPAAPERMSADARAVWAELAPRASDLHTVTASDLLAFELMCEDVAYAREVMRDSTASANQKVAVRRQAWAALAAFGLTPVSRSKANALPAQGGETDPLDEFAPEVQ